MKTTLFLLCGSILSLLPLSAQSTDPAKPNIIYIMVDDAGIGDFTNYGGKHIKTPIMDKMAKEGMQFSRAYSGNAVCGPTCEKCRDNLSIPVKSTIRRRQTASIEP